MFVVVPQCQAVTWVMYVASAGAGHGWDPAGLTALAGILLWVSPLERVCFIQSQVQALLPNLPWHMQPVGTSQGTQYSSHSK